MAARSIVTVFTLALAPALLRGQAVAPDSCKRVDLNAPVLWTGVAARDADIRTGPSDDYPTHESGQLLAGEEVQILQECRGWLEARVIPQRLISTVIRRNGRERAREMLLFWIRREMVRRR